MYVLKDETTIYAFQTKIKQFMRHYLDSYLLLSIHVEGKMIEEDGGIQWGALLSYNFALSLLIVTTNVVVLPE